MKLLQNLLSTVKFEDILKVRIGLHWTAVVIQKNGIDYCGLASTVWEGHDHTSEPRIEKAGKLENMSGRELAELALSSNLTLRSVGIASLNAQLQPQLADDWIEANAGKILAENGKNKRMVMVGRFPFTEGLRAKVKELDVLEQMPGPDDLPASQAQEVIPKADVVAITGMTLINHTLEDLLKLCQPGAFVMVLGPSTPLSPILFKYGVNLLSGAIVEKIEPVMRVVTQGGNFRQVHKAGVRLVNFGAKPVNF